MSELITEEMYDTNKILGFKINDKVRLGRRFFNNHNLQYVDLGIGVIQGKTLPDDKTLPSLIVRFPVRPEIFTNKILFNLLFTMTQANQPKSVLMMIHPVYLERINK